MDVIKWPNQFVRLFVSVGMKQKSQRFGQKFLPFCAGIACGIFISVLLFIVFASPAIFSQLWTNRYPGLKARSLEGDVVEAVHEDQKKRHVPVEVIVKDRKLANKLTSSEEVIASNQTIPIEVDPERKAIENPAWEMSLTPVHIPGFLTQELKLKKKLFVAIVNPSSVTSPMVSLIGKTYAQGWMIEGHGKVAVYSPMGVNVEKSNDLLSYHVPVADSNIKHPTVRHLYEVLDNLCNEHIDTHHHFFITTSNTYLRLHMLLNLTNRLDDSVTTWLGKIVPTDHDELQYLNDPHFYCDVGPGFVLTRHALQNVCPHIKVCRLDYVKDDVTAGLQLARCLRRFLNASCEHPLKDLFYDLGGADLSDPYADECPYKESISVHPLSDTNSFYHLHQFSLSQQLNQTARDNEYYHNIIQKMDRVLVQEGGMADDRLILGRQGNRNKYQHADVIAWDKIERNGGSYDKICTVNEAEPSRGLSQSDEVAVKKVEQVALDYMQEKYGNVESVKIATMFRHVVPGVGYQYMVDIKKDDEVIATVELDQPYDRMATIKTVFAPDVQVNFVLPLQDGEKHFQDFMQMFEQACMSAERAQNVALLVVLYQKTEEGAKPFDEKSSDTLNLLNLYKQKYPDLSLRWINGGKKPFSHIEGIAMAIKALPADTLVCSTNIFVQMSPEFLHHARLNTVPGERLFFPAAFQRHRHIMGEEISQSNGFFRSFDYSLFCGYKQDLVRACGGEPYFSGADLYEKALTSRLDVFRATEHALAVEWHERDCRSRSLAKNEQTTCEIEEKFIHLAASSVVS